MSKLLIYIVLCFCPAFCLALEHPETDLKNVGVDTKLGTQVDLSLPFTDSNGVTQALNQILASNRPTIIVPAYYDCPRLCGLVLDGVVKLINALPLKLSSDYQVAVVSFDATEGFELAAEREKSFEARLRDNLDTDMARAKSRWHFLVGKAESVNPLMSQIGFHFIKDHGEFAHGAAIMILTPDGKISQYFTGIEYPPFDVRMSLVEASQGGVGSALDHVFLFCFRFDQTKGKYVWAAFNLMRVGATLTLIVLASFIYFLRRGENRKEATLSST